MQLLFNILIISIALIIGIAFIKRGNYWLSEARKTKRELKK